MTPTYKYGEETCQVLSIDFVNDEFCILPVSELEGGSQLSIKGIYNINWMGLMECPHCGTRIQESGYGFHHSASCPFIDLNFNNVFSATLNRTPFKPTQLHTSRLIIQILPKDWPDWAICARVLFCEREDGLGHHDQFGQKIMKPAPVFSPIDSLIQKAEEELQQIENSIKALKEKPFNVDQWNKIIFDRHGAEARLQALIDAKKELGL